MHIVDVDVLILKLLSFLIDRYEEKVSLVLLLDELPEQAEVSQVRNDTSSLLERELVLSRGHLVISL